jgi:formylglycine-generating enzyme required for sulfatase activity
MKLNIISSAARLRRLLSAGALALGLTTTAFAQGTAFTYQGRLTDGVNPASGTYDFQFALYDSAGGAGTVGSPVPKLAVGVTNGLFTVALDFGDGLFTGAARWLEIAAKTNAASVYVTLSPRQPLTPTPYALYAPAAGSVPAAGLTGTLPDTLLSTNVALLDSSPTFSGTVRAAQLEVRAGQAVGRFLSTNGSSVSFLELRNTAAAASWLGAINFNNSSNTTPGQISYDASAGLTFRAGGAERLRITPDGNVGLGTSDPAGAALNVVGTVRATQFQGSGAGLTGLNAAQLTSGTVPLGQLPGAVVTNNETGVTLAGTFSGNGAALTNIPSSALVAAPPGMVLIPAGAFTMGNSIGDPDIPDATPISVTVSAFYMDVNLVTWSQWQSVYFWATNHGYGFVNAGLGKAANHPVHTVDWYDCAKWSNARSQQAGRPPVYYTDAGFTKVYTNGEPTTLYPNWAASGYRLPTEAEWEKAARGGLSGQRFPWGNVINQNLANYSSSTGSYSYDLGPTGYNPIGNYPTTSPGTSPVGSFAANGYGLNDMAGNVIEWCWDWHATPYAGGSDPHGPAGPLSDRASRGGGWYYSASYARCAARTFDRPNAANFVIGFRCVRGL